jgi:UDP-N-acetylmuramoyl-L-alanyl-D-glutamate--2,6-diaminopimelate ligase
VFGCGGDRDRGKRPLMGEIATRLADIVLVTSDNPRSEDPEQIIAEIMAGVARVEAARGGATSGGASGAAPTSGAAGDAAVATQSLAPPVRSITDRAMAIDEAIAVASAGDVLVIAGKGHEQGQEFAAGRKQPFDDVTVARKALRLHEARLRKARLREAHA